MKRSRALEAENAKLKRLLADAMPDNAALKGVDDYTRECLALVVPRLHGQG